MLVTSGTSSDMLLVIIVREKTYFVLSHVFSSHHIALLGCLINNLLDLATLKWEIG
jgi:hypothetical protein